MCSSTTSPPTSAGVYALIPNASIPSLLRIGCQISPRLADREALELGQVRDVPAHAVELSQVLEHDRVDRVLAVDALLEVLDPGPVGEPLVAERGEPRPHLGGELALERQPLGARRPAEERLVQPGRGAAAPRSGARRCRREGRRATSESARSRRRARRRAARRTAVRAGRRPPPGPRRGRRAAARRAEAARSPRTSPRARPRSPPRRGCSPARRSTGPCGRRPTRCTASP